MKNEQWLPLAAAGLIFYFLFMRKGNGAAAQSESGGQLSYGSPFSKPQQGSKATGSAIQANNQSLLQRLLNALGNKGKGSSQPGGTRPPKQSGSQQVIRSGNKPKEPDLSQFPLDTSRDYSDKSGYQYSEAPSEFLPTDLSQFPLDTSRDYSDQYGNVYSEAPPEFQSSPNTFEGFGASAGPENYRQDTAVEYTGSSDTQYYDYTPSFEGGFGGGIDSGGFDSGGSDFTV